MITETPAPKRRRRARSDIHRPGHPGFNPRAYTGPHGIFYFGSDEERKQESNGGEAEMRQAVANLQCSGYALGYGSPNQCGHCGSRMGYSALLTHPESREYIFVGEDCLTGTFEMDAEGFAEVREATRIARETQARKARIRELVDEHPLLADLTYPQLIDEGSDFYYSISAQLAREGRLSDRQIKAVENALLRDIDRRMQRELDETRKERLRSSGVKVPTGRATIEGKITGTKVIESQYGATLKMRVESPHGWAVWGTVPRGIYDPRGLVGAVVKFDATVEQAPDDQLFGFASRPTKASVIIPAPRENVEDVYG